MRVHGLHFFHGVLHKPEDQKRACWKPAQFDDVAEPDLRVYVIAAAFGANEDPFAKVRVGSVDAGDHGAPEVLASKDDLVPHLVLFKILK